MHNFNPLMTQLNPICHLLALLGAHPILHISRIRVNGPRSQSDNLLQVWNNVRESEIYKISGLLSNLLCVVTLVILLNRTPNKMQVCNRIYYSKVY